MNSIVYEIGGKTYIIINSKNNTERKFQDPAWKRTFSSLKYKTVFHLEKQLIKRENIIFRSEDNLTQDIKLLFQFEIQTIKLKEKEDQIYDILYQKYAETINTINILELLSNILPEVIKYSFNVGKEAGKRTLQKSLKKLLSG